MQESGLNRISTTAAPTPSEPLPPDETPASWSTTGVLIAAGLALAGGALLTALVARIMGFRRLRTVDDGVRAVTDLAQRDLQERLARPLEPVEARSRFQMEGGPGPDTVFNGRRVMWFGGTSYLGLQVDPDVIKAQIKAILRYGPHSATTRKVFGDTPSVRETEAEVAGFFGTDAALFLPAGYLTPFALAPLFEASGEGPCRAFVDASTHWCGTEAMKVRGWPFETFASHDAVALGEALRTKLQPGERPVVLVDGIVAVDGARAPLRAYYDALVSCDQPGGLLVDDSHGVGWLGKNHRGSLEAAGLWPPDEQDPVKVMMCASAAKAIGGHGGFIPLSRQMAEHAWSRVAVSIGASPSTNAAAAAVTQGLRLIGSQPERHQRLSSNIAQLRNGLSTLGVRVGDEHSPIMAFSSDELGHDAKRVAELLLQRGLVVPFLVYGEGSGVLRITMTSEHTGDHICQLLDGLSHVFRQLSEEQR